MKDTYLSVNGGHLVEGHGKVGRVAGGDGPHELRLVAVDDVVGARP